MPQKRTKKPPAKPGKPKKTQKKMASTKLEQAFIRDLSIECFLPPSYQPAENRELDFNLSTAVRKVSQTASCVDIAMRVRVRGKETAPFVIAEMIYEGVFNATYENDEEAEHLTVHGATEMYPQARETMLELLAKNGVKPPLPEKVDFKEMLQESTATRAV